MQGDSSADPRQGQTLFCEDRERFGDDRRSARDLQRDEGENRWTDGDCMTDLMAMVRLSKEVFEGSPCWEWLGAHRTSDGRPILNNRYVYRLFYEALIGPLPRGK